MSTPHLDRAAEESFRAGAENAARRIGLAEPIQWSSLSREDQEHVGIQARAAVSAALHDPDDPDSLARGLYDEMRKGTITPPWEEAHPTTQEGFRYEARCFVAAILGEAS